MRSDSERLRSTAGALRRGATRTLSLALLARASLRYWLAIFPRTALELRRLRRRAELISNLEMRQLALEALEKRTNIEGAAAFATLVPWRRRRRLVRALVAFQAAYNLTDLLAEQPGGDRLDTASRLHEMLCAALDADTEAAIESSPAVVDDGGYLVGILDDCRAALSGLPSYAVMASTASRAARRIVAFQSLSVGGREELERWAQTQAPAASRFHPWELAAAAGSSLEVFALMAAAAVPSATVELAAAVDGAYFPSIGALHSLLDSLVDEEEDLATGQLSLIACYSSPAEAADRMRELTAEACTRACGLPRGKGHELILAAMACNYIASEHQGELCVQSVREQLGFLANPIALIFRMRKLIVRLIHGRRSAPGAGRSSKAMCLAEGKRGADAGAA